MGGNYFSFANGGIFNNSRRIDLHLQSSNVLRSLDAAFIHELFRTVCSLHNDKIIQTAYRSICHHNKETFECCSECCLVQPLNLLPTNCGHGHCLLCCFLRICHLNQKNWTESLRTEIRFLSIIDWNNWNEHLGKYSKYIFVNWTRTKMILYYFILFLCPNI